MQILVLIISLFLSSVLRRIIQECAHGIVWASLKALKCLILNGKWGSQSFFHVFMTITLCVVRRTHTHLLCPSSFILSACLPDDLLLLSPSECLLHYHSSTPDECWNDNEVELRELFLRTALLGCVHLQNELTFFFFVIKKIRKIVIMQVMQRSTLDTWFFCCDAAGPPLVRAARLLQSVGTWFSCSCSQPQDQLAYHLAVKCLTT